MTRRSIAEQLAPPPRNAATAALHWTLKKPDGSIQRGEEELSEDDWPFIVKGMIAARERKAVS